MSMKQNRHHLLYPRRLWTSNNELKALRDNPDHIIMMPVEDHADLHRDISYVPALSLHIAKRALDTLSDFKRPVTPLDRISRLQDAIERSCDDERVDLIEYQVTHIAIQALEMQKEFLPVKTPKVYDLGDYR